MAMLAILAIVAMTPQDAPELGRFELFVEATNLLNEAYQEIRGVDMPPRWIAGGTPDRDIAKNAMIANIATIAGID